MTLSPIPRINGSESTNVRVGAASKISSAIPPITSNSAAAPVASSEEDSEIVVQIKEILDTRVRPAVAQDGGDIVFHDFDDGVVYLEMHGSCSGCPSSTATLKMGIENLLKHYVPEVVEVQAAQ